MAHKDNQLVRKLKSRNYEMYKYFQKALEILSVLNEKSYEAYIVGGAIRDLYLNIDFNDIDIATNATPQVLNKLFSAYEVDMEYEHLGSVVLKIDNFRYDVTTFRSEEYIKHRIKSVHYSTKLIDDIQRRDFTINALAMSLNQNIIDIAKGEKDLKKKTVRIIGKGKNRFKDDPTRILRGIHLVAKLNFKIDSKTEHAMSKCSKYLSELSNYKIITLLKKILNEKYNDNAIQTIRRLNLFKLMPKYSEWIKIISKGKKLNYLEKFAILFTILDDIPVNSGFSHKEIVEIKKICELSDYIKNNEITPIDIIQIGMDNLIQADKINSIINKKYISQSKKIKKMNRKMPIHSARELKISVDEIKNLLDGDNSKISSITNELLLLVINGEIKNNYSSLEEAVLIIIDKKENPVKKQDNFEQYTSSVEDNERILTLLENNKENMSKEGEIINPEYKKIEQDESKDEIIDIENTEVVDQESKNVVFNIEQNIVDNNESFEDSNIQTNEQKMLDMFYEDFNELYRIHRKCVFDELVVSDLNEDEINRYETNIKNDVKKILIEKNANYKYLNDRGII